MYSKLTPYDIIVDVILCHMHHIRYYYICGTEQILYDFIYNAFQIESFFCYTKYTTICDYICNRHSNNELSNIQCPIKYLGL